MKPPQTRKIQYVITVRQATLADVDSITQLFYETITTVNQAHYDPDQVAAWRAGHADKDRWLLRVQEQYFLVAENGDKLIGFISITQEGYLDLLFIHKDYQRQGVATHLLKAIETFAIGSLIDIIYSDVSITAQPFFKRHHFTTDFEQVVEVRGVEMKNYRMLKRMTVV